MRGNDTPPRVLRRAQERHEKAKADLRTLEERMAKDPTVTPGELVEARAAVDIAAARVRGVRNELADAADTAQTKRIASLHRRRERDAARQAEARRVKDEAMIRSGEAEQNLLGLALAGSQDAQRKLDEIAAWKANGQRRWPGYGKVPVSS